MFEKITEAEINERSMARVSTTPGRRTAFGEGNMDAEALKLRFDRLGRYIAGRLNEVFGGMADGSFASMLYIDHEGEKRTLADLEARLLEGDVDIVKIQTAAGTITLTELGSKAREVYDGVETGDLAERLVVVNGITLKKFYDEYLNSENDGGVPEADASDAGKFLRCDENGMPYWDRILYADEEEF